MSPCGDPFDLSGSAKWKKTAIGARILEKLASFFSRALELEDVMEERVNETSALISLESQESNDFHIQDAIS